MFQKVPQNNNPLREVDTGQVCEDFYAFHVPPMLAEEFAKHIREELLHGMLQELR